MNAVILAGGKGTRLWPYTTVFPKPMLPVGDRPILDIIINQLRYYGFKNIILSVGYMAELIQAYYQNFNALSSDVTLTYVKENQPLGTAGSLALIPKQQTSFLVINGDTLTTLDYRQLMQYHEQQGGIVTIASHKRQVKIDFGVLNVNNQGALTNYDEKPTLDYLVSMGVYVVSPEVLQYIPMNRYIDFPDLVKTFLSEGKKVQTYSTDDYWLDIGRHDDYENASKCFDSMKEKFLKQPQQNLGL